MKPEKSKLVRDLLQIYQAADKSNDGQRCMIAPSPKIREQLKKELNRLKKLSANEMLSNLLRPKQQTKVGLNDGVIIPGNLFSLGTSASAARAQGSQRSLLRGVVKVIVILVEFPDKKLALNKKHYEDLFFSTGVIKTGSVNEYYKEVSNGLINIQGKVVGPYKLPQKMKFYANNESGMSDNEPNARTMAADTATAANKDVDFSVYDNDHNGYVDAFVIIHAGRGAEETGAKGEIWSHKWVLPKQFNADGTKIYAYLTVPEDCKLGVCAHELGHLLFGFPDLYDDDYSSEGVGDWCLMGGGSWNNQGLTPAHPCAWCKKQQDWVQVINQSSNQKAVTISDVQLGKSIFRLWKDGGPGKEYFLIENRQQKKYDTYIPGNGLLVWHIDDQVDSNSNEFHYKVALVQADGKKDLEKGNNRGDTSDSWPGKLKKTSIDSKTNPNTLSYGGIDTNVRLTNIRMDKTGLVKADIYVSKEPIAPRKKTQNKITKKKKAAAIRR